MGLHLAVMTTYGRVVTNYKSIGIPGAFFMYTR